MRIDKISALIQLVGIRRETSANRVDFQTNRVNQVNTDFITRAIFRSCRYFYPHLCPFTVESRSPGEKKLAAVHLCTYTYTEQKLEFDILDERNTRDGHTTAALVLFAYRYLFCPISNFFPLVRGKDFID